MTSNEENLDFIAELDTVDLKGVGLSDLRLPPSGSPTQEGVREYQGSPWTMRGVQRKLFQETCADTLTNKSLALDSFHLPGGTRTSENVACVDAQPKLALELGFISPPMWEEESLDNSEASSPTQAARHRKAVVVVVADKTSCKFDKDHTHDQLVRGKVLKRNDCVRRLRRALRNSQTQANISSRVPNSADQKAMHSAMDSVVCVDLRGLYGRRKPLRQSLARKVEHRVHAKQIRCSLSTQLARHSANELWPGIWRMNLGQHAVMKAALLA